MISPGEKLAVLRERSGSPRLSSSTRRLQVGAWELVRCVGSGRWSRVFQARPTGSGENAPADYALKLMRGEAAAVGPLLERELEVTGEVSHPHLVSVLAAQLQGPRFLVTPWVAGASLRPLIAGSMLPSLPRALWLIRQAAEALAALHAAGWVHGDVKPENILVDHRAHVTLVDLGFAQRIRPATPASSAPFLGSPDYAAPELFASRPSVTPASDAFALGMTLFELLTGERPNFRVIPVAAAGIAAPLPASDPRRLMPQLPPSVARLLRRLLANEPLRRPLPGDELPGLLRDAEIESFAWRQPLVRGSELAADLGE